MTTTVIIIGVLVILAMFLGYKLKVNINANGELQVELDKVNKLLRTTKVMLTRRTDEFYELKKKAKNTTKPVVKKKPVKKDPPIRKPKPRTPKK